jgi:hypothetical protein
MAEGKNIEIRIAATGGDQAAAEVRKVEKAADNLSGGGSGQGLKALNAETNKVTRSGVQMGTGFSNVGFQLQDFAVQVGAGTGALRAFSQQAPQLLSGFGPLGVALGTVAAVGAPLVGILLDQAKATEGITVATQEATKATIDMARDQAQSLKMEEQSIQRKRDLTETLRQITSEQYSYNNSLQEQLDLLAETQAAENELAAARGQLEVDKAEGDPVKQEEIRNRVRKEAQARELQQIEERRKAASELIDRKTTQETEVGTKGENTAAQLRQQADSAGAGALQAEQLAALKTATAEDKAAAAGKLKGSRKNELDREVRKLREEARKATDEAKSLGGQETDLKSQADTVDSATKAEVEKLQDEANKLFDEVRKLAREAEKKQQLFGIRDEQGDVREGRVRRDQAGREARENFKDYQDFRRGQGKDQAEQRKDAGEAGRQGRAAERLLPEGVSDKFRKAVEAVSDGLQDGDQGGEIEKLLGLMEQLAAAVQKKGDDSLARRIEILEQRIRSPK